MDTQTNATSLVSQAQSLQPSGRSPFPSSFGTSPWIFGHLVSCSQQCSFLYCRCFFLSSRAMLTLLESHKVTMSQDVRQGPHQPGEICVWGFQSTPPLHPRPYTAGVLCGGWILTVSGSLSSCTVFLSGRAFTFRR